jgi:hypothetical protein
MSNTILTPTAVTNEALRVLHQKLNFIGSINRQYDDSFAKSGAKIGDNLKIRLPNQYSVRTGAALATQDTTESSVTLQVATQKGVDLNFTSVDLTLSLDDFSDRIIKPAMSVLAANIEYDAMTMYKDIYQAVWNSGSAATLAHVLSGRKILQDSLTPLDTRTANLDGQQMVDVVTDSKALFNDKSEISRQYLEGYVGRAVGFDWLENSLWPGHTRGGADASATVDTRTSSIPADGTATSSLTMASGSGTFLVGDVFTIGNVFKVHPESKANTGILQQFVVTANNAGGAVSIAFSPAIILAGPKQNVTIPTTSATAALLPLGTASGRDNTGLLYHKDAFTFATADLIMPSGVDWSARKVLDGISMRIVRQYDINSDKFPCRLDVLYGYKTIRPQMAVRLHNN